MGKRFLKRVGDVIGQYRVIGILGAGTEGDVYKVIDDGGRVRSLKLLRGFNMVNEARTAAQFYRQLRSCKAVKQFRHVGILERQQNVGKRPYLLYDFIEGTTLDKYLKTEKPLHCDDLIIKLCRALAQVHETTFAIGDFSKGRNILIEYRTQELIFCDLDYGTRERPNRDRGSDLIELRRMARQIYRQARHAPNVALLEILDRARSVKAAHEIFCNHANFNQRAMNVK